MPAAERLNRLEQSLKSIVLAFGPADVPLLDGLDDVEVLDADGCAPVVGPWP